MTGPFDDDKLPLTGLTGNLLHPHPERGDPKSAGGQGERFLRSIADHLPVYLSYWDRNGFCQFANQRYLDLFGMSMDQMRGITAPDLIGPEAAAEIADDVLAVLAGQYRQRELVRQHQGQPMHLWAQFVPDVHDDQVKGYFVLGTDITPLKRAESELQGLNEALIAARDRAETANLAKTAFLSNVSHEIRTPLSAIVGLTHLMQRDHPDPIAGERLGKLAQAAQHLMNVVNDVLDLSKIEAGKVALQATDFRLAGVLTQVIHLVAEQARAKGLELVVDIDERLPSILRGDEVRLTQALLNIVGNAVKFTETGSVLVRVTPFEQDEGGVGVRFAVCDTGVGVPADRLPKLFTSFEQVDGGTARQFGGTGLGLAITRRLAQMMAGQVGASSVMGIGSEFWFSAVFQPASQAAEPELASKLHDAKVLLVDDLPAARHANVVLARRLGWNITACSSVVEAEALMAQAHSARQPFEWMLLDFPMADVSTMADLTALRARAGSPGPGTILLTTGDTTALAEQALQAGCCSVWSKPLLEDECRARLLASPVFWGAMFATWLGRPP